MKCLMIGLAALAIGWAGLAEAGDVLTLSTGKKYEGIFDGYKNGSFAINIDRGPVKKESGSRVRTLALASPCNVTVVLQSGKAPDALRLLGYEKSAFQFDHEGQSVAFTLSQIKEVRVELDFNRVENTDEAVAVTQKTRR